MTKRQRSRERRVFDPLKHTFNPLAHLGYKEARELAEVLYTVSPQGENTLTVRNGKRALLRALLKAKRLDKVEGDEEVTAMIGDILVSPVLKRCFAGSRTLPSIQGHGGADGSQSALHLVAQLSALARRLP
jgi:hypothetical protein